MFLPHALFGPAAIGAWLIISAASAGESVRDSVAATLKTNPSIQEAEANRRATQFELYQAQGRLLPEIDLSASVGPEWIERPRSGGGNANAALATTMDGDDAEWLTGRQVELTLRQVLFDGWERANDIYRNAARVDAAAFRVLSRSEVLAIQAIEAHVDVHRQREVLSVALRNVERHQEILRQVRIRRQGGKAGIGEVRQVEERIEAARAAVVQVRQSLETAEARFKRVVGHMAGMLDRPGLPHGLPPNAEAAASFGRRNNPAVRAAEADIDVAERAAAQSESAFYPNVSVELSSLYGADINGLEGGSEEHRGKLSVTWRLFDGGQRSHRQMELAERAAQAQAARDARMGEVGERIGIAFADFQAGRERVAVLRRQSEAATEVVRTYEDEYKLSKRSLLDLLDAENTKFNVRIQLVSARSVEVFSAYRLLGEAGRLLENLDLSASPEAVADQRESIQRDGLFSVTLTPLSSD